MYQSFVFVTVTLVIFASILELLKKETFQNVLKNGLKAIFMILLGCILYIISLKLMTMLTGLQMYTNEYNTLDKLGDLSLASLPGLVIGAYQDWFSRLIHMYSSYPAILVSAAVSLLFLICAGTLIYGIFFQGLGLLERLLCLVLVLLTPFGMNMIYVLTMAESHDLMVYAIWLFFLLVLLLSRWLMQAWQWGKRKTVGLYQHFVCMLLVLFLLYGNVQFSNGMYLKKDIEYDAYLSVMTRVMDRIEETEGYVPGETPVVFVGLPKVLNPVEPGFKDYWNVTGMGKTDVIYTPSRSYYQAYIDYILGSSMILAEQDLWSSILQHESIKPMPCYPSKDCVAMIENTLVVKLGNYY